MPNIKQQKKRVRIAERQRLENLRYRSTVKTLTKRLEAAAAGEDGRRSPREHLELVHTIDKAASRGALHKNTAARKKARAARLAAGRAAPSAAPLRRRSAPAAARGRAPACCRP